MKVKSESKVAQSCPILCDPMDCTHQAPPSMGFSRQSTGVGCHCLKGCHPQPIVKGSTLGLEGGITAPGTPGAALLGAGPSAHTGDSSVRRDRLCARTVCPAPPERGPLQTQKTLPLL